MSAPNRNPFADDIVDDPRRVDYCVPGLNESVRHRVTEAIDALIPAGGKPTYQARASKALLVISPRAGFGKSHVIGSLFKALAGRATLVNVRPFQDADSPWKSILMRLVQELNFPAALHSSQPAQRSAVQLELFAHGVLGQLVAEELALRHRSDEKQIIAFLRQAPEKLVKLKHKSAWRRYLQKRLADPQWTGRVGQRQLQHGLNLHTPLSTWLAVLYHYAYDDQNWPLKQACVDWIGGEPIDPEWTRALGLRPAVQVPAQQTAGQSNELAKSRLLDLCQLAGFYRPFLICFDQTETYGKSAELARAWATTITDLCDEAKHQLTLITVNLDPWEKRLRPFWEQASLDRLETPYLRLDGINQTQARALLEYRLAQAEVAKKTAAKILDDAHWFEGLFKDRAEKSVREFLRDCASRWAALQSPQPAAPSEGKSDLAALFAQHRRDLTVKPRRLVFDRDNLFWLFNELANGITGISHLSGSTQNSQRPPRWRTADKEFVFILESSNHWKRWHNIAKASLQRRGKRPKQVFVCPRTPEQTPIPKPSWKVAAPDIAAAQQSGLFILQLTQEDLATLYAAQELYADALQGDIEADVETVSDFLRQQLAPFWQRILEWPAPTATAAATAVSASAPTPALAQQVQAIVRQKKFLSLEELMTQLPDATDRQAALDACNQSPDVGVHVGPQSTILQWLRRK